MMYFLIGSQIAKIFPKKQNFGHGYFHDSNSFGPKIHGQKLLCVLRFKALKIFFGDLNFFMFFQLLFVLFLFFLSH